MLVVARLLIQDFTMERSDMAGICGISQQEISSAMKKIQKILDGGHILIGLSDLENETLKRNMELRHREQRFLEDVLIREVAKLLLEDHRITGTQIAKVLNETSPNVSRAMKKIKERMGVDLDPLEDSDEMSLGMITGLTEKENRELRDKLFAREKEIQKEKELRLKEREMEMANKESMKDMNVVRSRKVCKKPATISPEGLAEWNRMHYDHRTGELLIRNAPADMPRKYPKKQIAAQVNTPNSYLIPAPLAKASGTAAGRKRIGVMQLS
ncbi:hypothetical protein V6C32_11020 [Desulforamulus ruminis]|uniref:hypothetical protein n=1 Tax=Desulforamulus ruminis TaxID=1564 RepID=UPI002FDB0971